MTLKVGVQGSTDKLILRTGRWAPIGLRYYLSVRVPFTNIRFRRHPKI